MAELDAFVTYAASNPSYQQRKAAVTNPTCRACIFGSESDAEWAPLLEDAAGELARNNVGGCIAIAANNNVGCGKAYQNAFDCRVQACKACAPISFSTCFETALKTTACANAAQAVNAACPTQPLETLCQGKMFAFEGPIRAQCVDGLQ